MRILVTGGAGFGGSGLTHAMLSQGHEVTVFDLVSPGHADLLADVIEHRGLRYRWQALQDIKPSDIDGHDIVVHMAAQADVPMGFESPRYSTIQNVDAIVCLLEAIRLSSSPPRLVYAGSGNEYGRHVYLPIDDRHPLTPHNPYSFSKAAAELAVWAWHRCYDLPVVVMNNGAVIGPNMRREIFIYKWLTLAIRGKPITLEGGDQTRDVTYVDDVVQAWSLAVNAPDEKVLGKKFFVSYGQELTVREIADICLEVAGSSVPIMPAPDRPGEEGQREDFDTSLAREVLGYRPQVGPVEGISRTFDWITSIHS